MAILIAVTVLVGLLLPLEQFGLPPALQGRLRVGDGDADGGGGHGDRSRPDRTDQGDERDGLSAQWGLFTAEFVRDRLHALEEELQRLDSDPDVFAKAFHTLAARSAYDALLGEERAVTEQPWWRVGEVVDAEVLASSGGLREVLEF